jgi:hypothetical protein
MMDILFTLTLSQQRFQVYSVRTRHPLIVKQTILTQAKHSSPGAHLFILHMPLVFTIQMRPPQTTQVALKLMSPVLLC